MDILRNAGICAAGSDSEQGPRLFLRFLRARHFYLRIADWQPALQLCRRDESLPVSIIKFVTKPVRLATEFQNGAKGPRVVCHAGRQDRKNRFDCDSPFEQGIPKRTPRKRAKRRERH